MYELTGCNELYNGVYRPKWDNPCTMFEYIYGCYVLSGGDYVPRYEGDIGDCEGPFDGCWKTINGIKVPTLQFEDYDNLSELQDACCGSGCYCPEWLTLTLSGSNTTSRNNDCVDMSSCGAVSSNRTNFSWDYDGTYYLPRTGCDSTSVGYRLQYSGTEIGSGITYPYVKNCSGTGSSPSSIRNGYDIVLSFNLSAGTYSGYFKTGWAGILAGLIYSGEYGYCYGSEIELEGYDMGYTWCQQMGYANQPIITTFGSNIITFGYAS